MFGAWLFFFLLLEMRHSQRQRTTTNLIAQHYLLSFKRVKQHSTKRLFFVEIFGMVGFGVLGIQFNVVINFIWRQTCTSCRD